ncbi:rRNA maturation RNase YbeY [Chitinophaga caeni]|uniref:Endoribonuclease YbeY n=1 Tax=Chitinophaga caeni TaxID=2029983 RepID=A0A291QRU5_9BACT|nr:rRNA maturation RNase YbeY [Chitinophaga caeni]ATL46631.1 rRNA maturation RNase YbeY [Chitinophaga caeni]
MAVRFSNLDVKLVLEDKTRLKKFIAELFKRESQGLQDLQYVFCTDAYLLEINQQFLDHDTYTDIITFELSPNPDITEGEIYISVERVQENATAFEESFNRELHRVIFHGALHLCGYRDKSDTEEKLMRQKEDEYLSLYFA